MEVKYMKRSIQIIPENKFDEVYLESALGLRKRGDWAKAERVLLVGLGPDTAQKSNNIKGSHIND